MSFGVEQSRGAGGQTLGGFIAGKAMQSRDDAKQEKERQEEIEKEGGEVAEEDKKGLFKKALAHNFGGGFLSGKKTFGENFKYKEPPKPEQPKSSPTGGGGAGGGAGAGLAKILTGGFGSLVADTTAIQGGLTAITQLLNSQLQSSSFTSSGISGVQAILADQLESQGELIELMGGERPQSASGAAGASGMFGMASSEKTGGETLTGFVMDKWQQMQGVINFVSGLMSGGGLSAMISRFLPGPVANMLGLGGGGAAASGGAAAGGGITAGAVATGAAATAAVAGTGLAASAVGEATRGLGDQWRALDSKKKKEVLKNPFLNTFLMMPPFTPVGIAAQTGIIPDAVLDMTEDPIARVLDGNSAVAETIGAPFRAIFELIMAGGDLSKSNAKMAEIDANLRENFRQAFDPNGKKGSWGSAWGSEYGTAESRIKNSSGSVMLGEAGKEAVVDLNSADAKAKGLAGTDDPGMKASGASMLAVVDQFVKGMGPLGTPVAQALGPDVQNLARQFGMSQALPNLKVGGGKFKEDGKAKKERGKFLENLISGSLEALGAKKKDGDKTTGGAPSPTGDANASRSNERQEETKETLENIPGAGTAMERVTPEGIKAAEGEKALMTEKEVKGTQVQLASGDKVMVPSADLNPVVGSNKKYWYDNKGQIYRWKPGEKVVQLYLDEVQKQGKADSFDLVRDLRTGVVRQVSTQRDWNPFNNASVLKPGEYSYRANDKLIDNKNRTPVWSRQNEKQDLGGIHGPEIAIPKQSNLTSFEDGGWFQRLTKWLTTPMGQGASDKAVPALQRAASSGSLGSVPQGLGNRRAATDAAIKDLLGHEKGGSMFGVANFNNKITVEQRLDDVEKMVKMFSGILMPPVSESSQKSNTSTASPPRTAPSAPPIAATNEVADEMSGAAIINVIGGGGSSPPIPPSSGSAQNTAEYANDASCHGLASVLCISSPWGSM